MRPVRNVGRSIRGHVRPPARRIAPLFVCLAVLAGPGVRSVAGQEGDCGDRGTLAVSVTDESGIVSIPAATVVLRWLDAERMPAREAAGLDGGLMLCVPGDATLAVLWAEFGDKSSAQATLAGLRPGETREVQLRIRDDLHSGRLLGRVVDRSTGRPVATAALSIAGRPDMVESDRMGHFRIAAVPVGTHALDVRRLGYAPLSHSVEVNTGLTTELEVGLVPEPVELEPLVVTTVRSRRLEIIGFYERKWWGEQLGLGTFFEADYIERWRPLHIEHLLATEASIGLSRGGDGLLVNRRGGGCRMRVFLDSNDVTGTALRDLVRPFEVAGVEIYKGAASVPGEFAGSKAQCGAVAIWTK